MTKLDSRALNRATLERQWLLSRQPRTALEAIEHLAGMQSQAPLAPYVGLWTRLTDFRPAELAGLMERREVVRLVLMRGTIHLVSGADALGLYPLLRELHLRGMASNQLLRPVLGQLDLDALAAAGREILEKEPMTLARLGATLAEHFPEQQPAVLAGAVRDLLPGVQLPPRGLWGKAGQPVITTAESWLGRPLAAFSVDELMLRYLAAFGPASVADVQAWSGLTGLGEVADRLRPRLRSYADAAGGRELFDLADKVLPDPDTPAPIRFAAEFDNLLLSHADRTRVIRDGHRRQVITVNGQVKGTILVDGFVAATWKIEQRRAAATLRVSPLDRLPKSAIDPILAEGNQLLGFAAAEGADCQVELAPPP